MFISPKLLMSSHNIYSFGELTIIIVRLLSNKHLLCSIHSQRLHCVSLTSEERGWKDKHFATNFMQIGGSILLVWPCQYFSMYGYGGHHFVNLVM